MPDNFLIDFDDVTNGIVANELVQVCPLNNVVASTLSIEYSTGFTASFIKFG